jgi:predicted Zn-dependent protease
MKTAWTSLALLTIFVAGCATSPLGRSQLTLVNDDQLNEMGVQAFRQIEKETPKSKDARVNAYVQCVAQAVASKAKGAHVPSSWEVAVFDSDQVNAFALPGGKIGVYTGLLKVAENQDQLATVIGHEVGHVIARHGNERVSQAQAAQGVQQLAGAFAGGGGAASTAMMGALGLGMQYGVLLPYGRTQESEADKIGLDLMAEAGFDPRESVKLWQNMARASGGNKPPELLSTHPAEATRINNLNARMQSSMKLAKGAKRPNCQKV